MDVLGNIMLTYSSIKLADVPSFILYVVVCIQMSGLEFLIQKDQVLLSCSDMSSVGVHSTLLHDTQTRSFWITNFDLDVCMHITTYSINRCTSMNFIQEYVGIMLSVIPKLLYL
jgi:hypothetical protein